MKSRIWTIVLCLILAHCAEPPPTVPNRDAFDSAVRDYLKLKSMDMAIAEYREFEMGADEDTAVALIKMKYGGEGYAKARVRFRFFFEQTEDGWRVVKRIQIK